MTNDQGPIAMPDNDQNQKRSVNDISHLFLSNVRDLAGNGAPRPQRTPPGQTPATAAPAPAAPPSTGHAIDLTPAEFEHAFGIPAAAATLEDAADVEPNDADYPAAP